MPSTVVEGFPAMGYSGRYHAASLVAVFIALAIGILIGIGLADDVVSGASEQLENSLRSDLDEAESQADDLGIELGRERDFGERIYPALVSNRLIGSSVALVGFGQLSEQIAADVEAALAPAGATVEAVAVVSLPPDREALADAAPSRFSAAARRGGDGLVRLGRVAGAGLAGGSSTLDALRATLFSRFSGALDDVDRVVFAGGLPDDLEPEQQADSEDLMGGMLEGAAGSAAAVVGVERTGTDPTTLGPFSAAGIATVDHLDLIAGRVSLVFSLLGAGGDWGVKEGADSFLPELISPGPEQPPIP
jgi:hypothetical protein